MLFKDTLMVKLSTIHGIHAYGSTHKRTGCMQTPGLLWVLIKHYFMNFSFQSRALKYWTLNRFWTASINSAKSSFFFFHIIFFQAKYFYTLETYQILRKISLDDFEISSIRYNKVCARIASMIAAIILIPINDANVVANSLFG